MNSTVNAVTQAEFARLIGVGRSYVTALKKADRLVINEIGNVLVEESKKRIAETADPNRDDVRERFVAERGQPVAVDAPEIEETEEQPTGPDDQRARAKKEYFLAEQARIAFERDIGKLIAKADVERAIEDVISAIRQTIENLPHRTAPELVGKDLDAIRATLKQEVHAALSNMDKEFSKRLSQMGSEE